ncbi:MAG: hypothetical protein AB9866_06235 [Syntrophobacteraceae bacterium]
MNDFKLLQDTVCAIATPIGEAGIGIIRISGPDALNLARRLFQPRRANHSFKSHTLHYGWIRDPSTGEIIDEVLLSYMAAPRTYTCEDVVEINCHSGYAVLNRILELVTTSGARIAQPGEFTRRAFLNGRIDLSQAEAVIDIIRSRSEQGLLMANRHLRGEASGDYREVAGSITPGSDAYRSLYRLRRRPSGGRRGGSPGLQIPDGGIA